MILPPIWHIAAVAAGNESSPPALYMAWPSLSENPVDPGWPCGPPLRTQDHSPPIPSTC